eukprot:3016502-Prymnesium_polylepis.1
MGYTKIATVNSQDSCARASPRYLRCMSPSDALGVVGTLTLIRVCGVLPPLPADGQPGVAAFNAAASFYGMQIVSAVSIFNDQREFSSQINDLKRANA